MTTQEVLDCLKNVKRQGDGWIAHCPGHEDHRASLSIASGSDGRTLLRCHAGCSVDTICEALGIKLTDLFARSHTTDVHKTYNYEKGGALHFQAVRLSPKGFRQRRPDEKGGWIWDMKGVKPFLYNYDRIVNNPDRWVFIVEGEEDADNLATLDFIVTTCPMGAGKWRTEYSDTLTGRRVMVLFDNDEPGRIGRRTRPT